MDPAVGFLEFLRYLALPFHIRVALQLAAVVINGAASHVSGAVQGLTERHAGTGGRCFCRAQHMGVVEHTGHSWLPIIQTENV